MAYRITEKTITQSGGSSIEVSYVKWDGQSDLTAEDLCAPIVGDSEEEKSAIDEAKEFLRAQLANGAVETNELKRSAKAATISEATLRRAKASLGVVAKHEAEEGGARGAGKWVWELPAS